MKNLILIACALFLFACKTSKPGNTKSTSAASLSNIDSQFFEVIKFNSDLSISTGNCLGECPAFDLFYLKDSLMVLRSKANMLESGNYYYFPNEADAQTFNEMMALNWTDFKSEYSSTAKDLPSYSFSIKQENGSIKSVNVLGKGPDQLFQLKERIISTIKDYSWVSAEQSD